MSYAMVATAEDDVLVQPSSLPGSIAETETYDDEIQVAPDGENAPAGEEEQDMSVTVEDVAEEEAIPITQDSGGAKKVLGRDPTDRYAMERRRRGRMGLTYSPDIPLPCCVKIGRVQYAEVER
jgi:hypothetical protein